jgi:hypothetical protein
VGAVDACYGDASEVGVAFDREDGATIGQARDRERGDLVQAFLDVGRFEQERQGLDQESLPLLVKLLALVGPPISLPGCEQARTQ